MSLMRRKRLEQLEALAKRRSAGTTYFDPADVALALFDIIKNGFKPTRRFPSL